MGSKIKTMWDQSKENVMNDLSKKIDRGGSVTASHEDIVKESVRLSKITPYVKPIRKRKPKKEPEKQPSGNTGV